MGMPYMGAFHLSIPIILMLHNFIYAPPSFNQYAFFKDRKNCKIQFN